MFILQQSRFKLTCIYKGIRETLNIFTKTGGYGFEIEVLLSAVR